MNPESISVNDLLKKRDFRKWVKHPCPELDSFWKSWGEGNPKRMEAMEQAKLILLSINFKKSEATQIDNQRIFNRIKLSINKGEKEALRQFLDWKQNKKKTNDGNLISSTFNFWNCPKRSAVSI